MHQQEARVTAATSWLLRIYMPGDNSAVRVCNGAPRPNQDFFTEYYNFDIFNLPVRNSRRATMSDMRKQEAQAPPQALLKTFLGVYKSSPAGEVDQCREFLIDRPPFQKPTNIMPVDEYEARFQLAKEFEKKCQEKNPKFQINRIMLSTMMVAPLAKLRDLVSQPKDSPTELMATFSGQEIHILLEAFFRGPQKAAALGSALSTPASAGKRKVSGDRRRIGDDDGPLHRNQEQAGRCRLRDNNKCILTGQHDPDVCHIVPFSWTETTSNSVMMREYLNWPTNFLFTQGEAPDPTNLCRDAGSADWVWNLICLSPVAHRAWSRAFFGLEYQGKWEVPDKDQRAMKIAARGSATGGRLRPRAGSSKAKDEEMKLGVVQLKFHWLRRGLPQKSGQTFRSRVDLEKEAIYENSFLSQLKDNLRTLHFPSGRRIASGHVFEVEMALVDVPHFIGVIRYQWALNKIAAMSGFAETLELDEDDDDEEVGEAAVVLGGEEEAIPGGAAGAVAGRIPEGAAGGTPGEAREGLRRGEPTTPGEVQRPRRATLTSPGEGEAPRSPLARIPQERVSKENSPVAGTFPGLPDLIRSARGGSPRGGSPRGGSPRGGSPRKGGLRLATAAGQSPVRWTQTLADRGVLPAEALLPPAAQSSSPQKENVPFGQPAGGLAQRRQRPLPQERRRTEDDEEHH
ncbi:hypothetical protein HIM_07877 [Hirsutella minnesotensis 3608]|uniref:HNH nuclease domain-containing protein n=1 Tax=Hirsutella minnesotensis 3608 TaxID=1043627 RepID=A0A0F7ZMW0_9HYPO|nr:hypothetical protein HIM_07877 [Hirsutella minnesotensis 3608]